MFNIKQRIKYVLKREVVILMYHRIANPAIDPWQLAVSAENFEQHLKVLERKNIVKPLPQIIEDLKKKKINKKSVAITFDDGYEDNYLIAKPLLEKYNLPATFFITSKSINSANEFWWDELAQILLQTQKLPQILSLDINGHAISFDLGEETLLTEELANKHKNYTYFNPAETLRSRLYYKLWKYFSAMPDQDQMKLMEQIRKWAGIARNPQPAYRCLSSEQVKELSACQLFHIGGHTVSHPALPFYNEDIQQKEILGNKLHLEQITEKKIDLFAYPSGKYNDVTIKILNQMGFESAFTTNAKKVKKYADPFTLGRFQVTNYSGDQLRHLLLKWFAQ